jgi:hypothetical protein
MVISTLGTFRIGTATKGPIAVRAMSWDKTRSTTTTLCVANMACFETLLSRRKFVEFVGYATDRSRACQEHCRNGISANVSPTTAFRNGSAHIEYMKERMIAGVCW